MLDSSPRQKDFQLKEGKIRLDIKKKFAVRAAQGVCGCLIPGSVQDKVDEVLRWDAGTR